MGNPLEILKGWDAGKQLALINRLGGRDAAEAILRDEGVRIERLTQVGEMFASPPEQIARMLEVNELAWKDRGITKQAIHELGDPPECPVSDEHALNCIVLLSETGDALDTLVRNWLACRLVHGLMRTWQWDGLLFTAKGVRRRENAKPRKPGLRWAIAELGRSHKGNCVRDARVDLDSKEAMGMGQELPLIAAMHPVWARAMDGDTIPFVDAPDLEVAPVGKGGFGCAPDLNFDRVRGRVSLDAGGVGSEDSRCGSGFLR